MSEKSNYGCSSSVENGSIIQDDLGSNNDAGDLMDVVPNFIVVYEVALNSFQHQFFV